MAISGLSRVRTELMQLLVIPLLAPHPVQTDCESTRHRYFRSLSTTTHHEMEILTAPAWITAHCHLRCFHQQKAQHRTPLFGDMSQPSATSTRFFQWYQSQVAGHLLTAVKPLRCSDDEHEGQRGQCAHPGVCHQALDLRTLFRFSLDGQCQLSDGRSQSV